MPDRLSHLGQIIDISIIFYTSEKTVPQATSATAAAAALLCHRQTGRRAYRQ